MRKLKCFIVLCVILGVSIYAQEMPVLSVVHRAGFFVSSVDTSPDGKYIVSASWASVRVWETKDLNIWNGERWVISDAYLHPPIYELSSGANCVKFLNNDAFIAAGVTFSDDLVIKMVNFKKNTIADLTRHYNNVPFITISPDGNRILTSSNDESIREWDLTENGLTAIIKTGSGLSPIDYHPKGDLIASGSDDGKITIWGKSKKEKEPVSDDDFVWYMDFGLEGQYIAIKTFDRQNAEVRSIKYNADGTFLAAGFENGTIIVWDTKDYKKIQEINSGDLPVGIHFTKDNKIIADNYREIRIFKWNKKEYQLIRTINTESISSDTVLTSGENYILTGTEDGIVRIWAVNNDFNPDLPIGLIKNADFPDTLTFRSLFMSNKFSTFINNSFQRVQSSLEYNNIENGIMHSKINVFVNSKKILVVEFRVQTNRWFGKNYITYLKVDDLSKNESDYVQCDGTDIGYENIAKDFSRLMNAFFDKNKF
ncbi:MAG: hypothetical protein LBJ31_07965 [Treponema sp.]|nr:hypothetical protein [Treponema sp.]